MHGRVLRRTPTNATRCKAQREPTGMNYSPVTRSERSGHGAARLRGSGALQWAISHFVDWFFFLEMRCTASSFDGEASTQPNWLAATAWRQVEASATAVVRSVGSLSLQATCSLGGWSLRPPPRCSWRLKDGVRPRSAPICTPAPRGIGLCLLRFSAREKIRTTRVCCYVHAKERSF
jgi:hypothetical protein